ncbi:DUF349 domain-containing protein [Wohlfahrtiimonas populi]|uniref:DUF349 domain-containing protein n=1 Tax=Wohlfahrtiimonas populi TaxID=1940240 RepID=UPI00098D1D9C|nr:DUF349 domain-containing protein [Wohlfahrtiimonas populi]
MFGFFKPKWQHRNSNIRIEAIHNLALDKETILKIAQTDKDVDVRIAALQKITELNILYAILLQEPCSKGKVAVLKQISAVLLQQDSLEVSVQSFMKTTVRRDFPLVDLLMACDNRQLKQLLFTMINLQKDLPKLVDANYVFSVEELVLIDDLEVLSHLVKKANITDKKVLAHLKDAIQQQEDAERKTALKAELLKQYAELAEVEPLAPLNIFSALEKEWNENQLGNEQLSFKEAYLARHNAQNELRQEKLAALTQLEQQVQDNDLSDSQQMLAQLKELSNDSLFSLKERANIQSLIQKIELLLAHVKKKAQNMLAVQKHESPVTTIPVQQKVERIKIDFDREQFQQDLGSLEKLINVGSLQEAEQLSQKLTNNLKALGHSKDATHFTRLLKQASQPLYDQLDTARWGIYQGLESLCDHAEELANNGSIDLISVTLKQLREDWNQSKKGIARVPQKLYQRFESACKAAHQRLLNERDHDNQARAVYLKEAEELLNALSQLIEQLDWQNPNWANLIEMRQKFLQEWNRYLNQYSTDGALSYGAPLFLAKDKQKLERTMRQILKPLDTAMQNERKKEKKRREDEIALLQTLLDEEKIREAVEKAKQFNKSFNPTVRSKRHDENLLWKELRVVNDQIFALREEYVSAEESEKSANAEQKHIVLNELKALCASINANSHIHAVEEALNDIDNRWMDIGVVAKRDFVKLENEFKELMNKAHKQLQQMDQQKEIDQRTALLNASAQMGELEAQVARDEAIEIDEQLYDVADAALRKRLKCLEQIVAGQANAKAFLMEKLAHAESLAFELVLHREILLDKASPEDDKDARLAMQVRVLEAAMTNLRNEKDKKHQLKLLDEKWLENVVGIIPDSLYQRFR